jgi:hypothetical protein
MPPQRLLKEPYEHGIKSEINIVNLTNRTCMFNELMLYVFNMIITYLDIYI